MTVDLEKCHEIALLLTKEAGDIIRERIFGSKTIETKSSDVDFVTETDKEVETLIISGLQSHFPDHKFIGEESTENDTNILTTAPTWIIDPVDGTMNFVHGNPNVCVSVGLYVHKRAEVGIIHIPVYNQMFSAIRGKGAHLNGERIKVSGQTELSKALVSIESGTSRDPEKLSILKENYCNLIDKIHGFRSTGAAAANLAMVAMGATDIFIEFGLHAWDMAAGEIIVKEAGGVVLDPSGNEFDVMNCRCLVAATKQLADEIIPHVKQYYPKRDDE